MNQLPIMPVRVKYAEETSNGQNIDAALQEITGDVSELETTVGDSTAGLVKKVSDLETTVGDTSAGLVKDVDDLEIAVAGKTDIASVQALIEGGTISNAKPLYFHPISIIKRGDSIVYYLGFIILDNSPTAYTFTTFKTFIDSLYTAYGTTRMLATGYYDDVDSVNRHCGAVSILAKTGANELQFLMGNKDDGVRTKMGTWDEIFDTPTEFTDGVNKIN